METLRLYRGITVKENESEQIIQDIKCKGLYQHPDQFWGGFIWKNLKPQIESLYAKVDLTREDTSPASVWIEKKTGNVYENWQEAPTREGHRKYTEGEVSLCFADKEGAIYYATKHNVNESKGHATPLLIEIDIDIDNVAIDGRDFLYTVFGFIEPNDLSKIKRQAEKLKSVYGNKIEKYIEKIIIHPKSEKFAICDLVIIDNDIIKHHLKNELLIGGRYGTIFKSAFFVKVPILPENIVGIEILNKYCTVKNPDITLNNILER
jgi:hypothetical protein